MKKLFYPALVVSAALAFAIGFQIHANVTSANKIKLRQSILFKTSEDDIHAVQFDGNRLFVLMWRRIVVLNPWTGAVEKAIPYNKGKSSYAHHILHYHDFDDSLALVETGSGVRFTTLRGEDVLSVEGLAKDIDSVDIADLNSDASPEIYLQGYNCLLQLDVSGKEMWRSNPPKWKRYAALSQVPATENLPALVISQLNDSSTLFSTFECRDFSGNVVKTFSPVDKANRELNWFQTVVWPEEPCIIAARGRRFVVLDMDGRLVLQKRLPFSFSARHEIFHIYASAVRFHEDRPPYLAILTRFRSSVGTSGLFIFSSEGKLVFEDEIPRAFDLISVPTADGTRESLLVACYRNPERVMKFEAIETTMQP